MTKPTGRENRVIFFCGACGHRGQPLPWPMDRAGVDMHKCQNCPQGSGMHFVAYEDGVENVEALALVNDHLGNR